MIILPRTYATVPIYLINLGNGKYEISKIKEPSE